MSHIGKSLSDLEHHVGNFSVETFAGVMRPALVEEALETGGRASRRIRSLPADLVVWLVIAMGLFRPLSIPAVWARLSDGFRGKLRRQRGKKPTTSAFVQARRRLGADVVRTLFERFVGEIKARFSARHLWRGMNVVALDGTTAKTPDSKRNRQEFGGPSSHRGKSGYPFVRIVTLVAVYTHLVLAAAVAGWSTGENPLALTLLAALDPGSLVLMDRGFVSYGLLWSILKRPGNFVIRGRRKLRMKKRVKLGEGDWLADFETPRKARKLHPEMPKRWRLRVIHYRIPGFRPAFLITSLLDPVAYSKSDLVELYHARWEEELAYDEIKTHMASVPVVFRSQTPDGVRQEAWGLLLAYNLVRALIAEAATPAGLSPLRISFLDSLRAIDRSILKMAVASSRELRPLYAELLQEIASCRLPERRKRRFPRAVKIKMSSWPLKRKKRA